MYVSWAKLGFIRTVSVKLQITTILTLLLESFNTSFNILNIANVKLGTILLNLSLKQP